MHFQVRSIGDTRRQKEKALAKRLACSILKDLSKEKPLIFLANKKEALLSVSLISPLAIRRLNNLFRKKNKPTNILSFPSVSDIKKSRNKRFSEVDLGDILICPEIVLREARSLGVSFYSQFFWTILHGILHILGYDHERSASEKARMEALEAKIKARYGL